MFFVNDINESVELGQGDEVDAVDAPGVRGVGRRVADPRHDPVLPQAADDVGDLGVAHVRAVLPRIR